MKLAKLLIVPMLSALLTGCFSTSVMKDVELTAEQISKGPKQLPVKNVTGFSGSLRCMDDLFLSFGVSRGDYVMLAEELKDKTKKVNAGTRQMMITAISDMTKRSGALKLITYGADSGNLISFLSEAGNKGVYQNIPAFDIIGSISQYDDSVYKKQADAAAELAGTNNGSTIGGGGGKSSSSSVTFMTVDLSIVTAHNLALLPGVSTRNSVSLFNKGSASSYDAGISKTGISYSFSSDTKDAVGQSLRGLIELSTIELIGKLVKLPYWNCLGMDPNHPDIRNEVSDWFFQLQQTKILHRSLKLQLKLRGLFNGAIDETITQEYIDAIVALKQRMGLESTPSIDANFYGAFLNQVPVSVARENLAYAKLAQADKKVQQQVVDNMAAKKVSSQTSPSPKEARIAASVKPAAVTKAAVLASLNIQSDIDLTSANVGDSVRLKISADQDGFLACYFQRGNDMVRVFPNRFSKGALLSSSNAIELPNSNVYSFVIDESEEHVHCFLTPSNIQPATIAAGLPASLKVEDFAPISNLSISDVHQAYQRASSNQVAYHSIQFNGE